MLGFGKADLTEISQYFSRLLRPLAECAEAIAHRDPRVGCGEAGQQVMEKSLVKLAGTLSEILGERSLQYLERRVIRVLGSQSFQVRHGSVATVDKLVANLLQ